MTENEATRELKSIKSFMKNHGRTTGCDFLESEYEALNMAIKALEENQKSQAIGTIEEFKALKEKNVAKKVVTKGQGHEADCYCPNCNTFLGSDQDFCFNQTKHCGKCGQAVDYD